MTTYFYCKFFFLSSNFVQTSAIDLLEQISQLGGNQIDFNIANNILEFVRNKGICGASAFDLKVINKFFVLFIIKRRFVDKFQRIIDEFEIAHNHRMSSTQWIIITCWYLFDIFRSY